MVPLHHRDQSGGAAIYAAAGGRRGRPQKAQFPCLYRRAAAKRAGEQPADRLSGFVRIRSRRAEYRRAQLPLCMDREVAMLSTRTMTGGRRGKAGRRRWFLGAVAAAAVLALIGLRPADDGAQLAPSMYDQAQLRPATWPADAITVGYLGHATLLIDYLGVHLITDPAFFHRVGLNVADLFTIGPARRAPVPLRADAIAPLDLILITHAHMDHLDLPSLRALPKTAAVVACDKCSQIIAPLGFKDVRELRWGE